MNKETLKYVIAQTTSRPLPAATPRSLELPLTTRKVVTLVGIRRSGKDVAPVTRRWAASRPRGSDRRQIIYLNFEDDRLLPVRSDELDLILRAHEELNPAVAGRRKYLFLDEVQRVPSWETFVRRVHDTEDVHIFVTGSSSHLLAREVATGLRGRSISYEVFPLSFEEFLAFRGIDPRALLAVVGGQAVGGARGLSGDRRPAGGRARRRVATSAHPQGIRRPGVLQGSG